MGARPSAHSASETSLGSDVDVPTEMLFGGLRYAVDELHGLLALLLGQLLLLAKHRHLSLHAWR